MKVTITGTIVKDYLLKYPNFPSLTLAKLIYSENSEAFKSVEQVRTIIRTYRGSKGKVNRDNLKDRRFLRDLQQPYNPFSLPESDEKEFEPFIIPKQYKKGLIFGDAHIPYHNVTSLSLMLEYALKQKVDFILLNGDIIDFYSLSVFNKDPRERRFNEELLMMRDFLDVLKTTFKKAKIFYKLGNHEERFETYLRIKAPELIGTTEFTLDVLLQLGERNIQLIKDKRTVKFNNLNILHGHELKGSIIVPVNAARGIYLKTSENTLVNHFHTDTKHSKSSLTKIYISCWSIGCLCSLHPEYAVNNRWTHGFAIVERVNEDDFTVATHQIIKNKIL